VLIGPAGTGKTMVAKAAAKILGLDLITLDIGSMFDKYVGASEAKIRAALQMVAAMPNALLMVDEIDKAVGGAHENQAADSGVASRVLSYLLNWLSERDMGSSAQNRCFVMVTMNRTAGVPEELLRAGRFDRVWATDLPDKDERSEILRIHLEKRGVDTDRYGNSLKRVVSATDEYTGAEIEEIVISARNDAYDDRMSTWEGAGKKGDPPDSEAVRPNLDELLSAASEITPVARLNADAVAKIRDFCRRNAYPVNGERVTDTSRSRADRKVSTKRTSAGSTELN
jgi:SpoVK/Ycf46/Vps4 family AAA+-type ATPase